MKRVFIPRQGSLLLRLCLVLIGSFGGHQSVNAEVSVLGVGPRERLLILAPHPDDETLSSAGLIQQVYARAGSIRSVVVTSGDAYVDAVKLETDKKRLTKSDFLLFGEKRLHESRLAAALLGHGFLHLDLLGFSDGFIYPALVSHWRHNQPFRSDFTGFDHVPYRDTVDPGMRQDGQDLLNELIAILDDTQPTIISFPDVMEDDSDHAGLGMFALLAIHEWMQKHANPKSNPKLLAYLIHWPHWPEGSDWGLPSDWSDKNMVFPPDFPVRGHKRACINLSAEEVSLKRKALAVYQTQQRVMADFLASFVRRSECFTVLTPESTQHIEAVLEQWQHSRKAFSLHPLDRRKI